MFDKMVSKVRDLFNKEERKESMKTFVKTALIRKSDNSTRHITYINVSDMSKLGLKKPEDPRDGLVYDLENKGFRTVNSESIVGNVVSEEMSVEGIKAKYNLK